MARLTLVYLLLELCLMYLVVGQKSGKLVPFDNTTESGEDKILQPTVFIAVLVRNKGHTLPYFLTLLEKLDYPKERIAIW